ncbi:lemA family protein [Geobacter sp. OR-1]|uniref:LemA family protein n=1 Tax=Geobacter sp. OR-1 TaxID=1266765 RepID=UPI00054349CE|nr:LemA family protein [Geobacter sp. OR-1]GAM09862.1 lemA family protein [Geobacter sp. OR-1]
MNKWHFALLSIVALLTTTACMLGNPNQDDAVAMAWSKAEAAYQQRLALIGPFLQRGMSLSSASAELTALAESFKAATSCTPATPADPAGIAAYRDQQEALTATLAKLVVSQETFPKLMKDPVFRTMLSRLDEVESRITRTTADYNRMVHERAIKEQSLSYKVTDIIKCRSSVPAQTPREKVKLSLVMPTPTREMPTLSPNRLTVAAN